LLSSEFRVQSFWYNSNIHPVDEYAKRKDSLVRYVKQSGFQLHEGPEESMESWVERWRVSGLERCSFCYTTRLYEAALTAARLGIGSFSTTLLVSPYQKHEIIRDIGTQAAHESGVSFIYRDFRQFFHEGKNQARAGGAYMQKYCGCIFSRQQREEERRVKEKNKK
jgi:hypothetical protein